MKTVQSFVETACVVMLWCAMQNVNGAYVANNPGASLSSGGRVDKQMGVTRNVVPALVEYRFYTISFDWQVRRAVRLVRGPKEGSTIKPMSVQCESDTRFEERYLEYHHYAFDGTILAYVTPWSLLEDISEEDLRHDWTASAPAQGTGGPVPFCPTRWFHYDSVQGAPLPAGVTCTVTKYRTYTYTLTSLFAPEGVGYEQSLTETIVDGELLGTVCVNFTVDPNSTNEPPYRLLLCAVSPEHPYSMGAAGSQGRAWRTMLQGLGTWIDRLMADAPGRMTRRRRVV